MTENERMRGRIGTIEVLHIAECPGWERTIELSRQALDELGIDAASVSARLIVSTAEARRTHFAGSPTVLIDGVDPFPSEGPIEEPTCRVYAGADGLSPHPPYRDLLDALRRLAR